MLERRFDDRLLGPGWAGDISDDEVFFIQEELLRDKKLAYQWGFAPSRGTRPADAIRRVALEGDPNHRNANVSLTRPNFRPESQPESLPDTPSEIEPEVQSDVHSEPQTTDPPTILTLWDFAGIDVPQTDLTEVVG